MGQIRKAFWIGTSFAAGSFIAVSLFTMNDPKQRANKPTASRKEKPHVDMIRLKGLKKISVAAKRSIGKINGRKKRDASEV